MFLHRNNKRNNKVVKSAKKSIVNSNLDYIKRALRYDGKVTYLQELNLTREMNAEIKQAKEIAVKKKEF